MMIRDSGLLLGHPVESALPFYSIRLCI